MRNKLTKELAVCGFNAVSARGAVHPDTINRLFLQEDRLAAFAPLCKALAQRKRPYKLCDAEELQRICKSTHHQGVVAMIEEPEISAVSRAELDSWAGEGKTGLVLHELGNDHNFGAIVRAAAFFDASFIVLSGGSLETLVTTSAYRVAEGGMEHVEIRCVRDTLGFLTAASRVLITIGTDVRARQRIQDMPTIIRDQTTRLKAAPARPGIALVVGNEEAGLSREVKDCCSALVRIPGTGVLESLNVAQATALFLHTLYQN
ncbi:MAG: RNA methyltransferase [Spirochaetaceae bacterium]|jgi:TrmH RNA methyltransferase|nr:RNA methyltransferase [Spirochaetaceae bacterium]